MKVQAVVEGRVMRSGERIGISAQLIEVASEKHLWADAYEYDKRDELAIERDVARAIAHEIQIKLTPK